MTAPTFTDEQFTAFRDAYVITMLWSTTGDDDEPLDANYSENDLSAEASDRIDAECEAFLNLAAGHIKDEPYVSVGPDFDLWGHAGHDFWLTRVGHGAGFWDGDWPLFGDKLTELAKSFGNEDPYVGDDGKIYLG